MLFGCRRARIWSGNVGKLRSFATLRMTRVLKIVRVGSRLVGLLVGVVVAEEVGFVPGGTRGRLRYGIATKEGEAH
jgi:hypothetical protein